MSRSDAPKVMWAPTVCPFPPPSSLTLPSLVVSVHRPMQRDVARDPMPGSSPTAAPVPPVWKLRRIRADEEILVSYGPNYWRGAASSTHSTEGIPEWEWDLS